MERIKHLQLGICRVVVNLEAVLGEEELVLRRSDGEGVDTQYARVEKTRRNLWESRRGLYARLTLKDTIGGSATGMEVALQEGNKGRCGF